MRKLAYEQLEGRVLLATLAAFELLPSPIDIVEASTRSFIDSTLKQVEPNNFAFLRRSSVSTELAFENGMPLRVTNVVVDVGLETPRSATRQIVFTFTIHSTNSISFHAALIPNSEITRTAFPIEAKVELEPLNQGNASELQTELRAILSSRSHESLVTNHFAESEADISMDFAEPLIQTKCQKDLNPITADLAWRLLDAGSPDFDTISIDAGSTNVASVAAKEKNCGPSEHDEDTAPLLRWGTPPLSSSMSFLEESCEPSSAAESRVPGTPNPSAILQVLVGLSAGPTVPLNAVGYIVAPQQSGANETENPHISLKAVIFVIGAGLTFRSRRRENRRRIDGSLGMHALGL